MERWDFWAHALLATLLWWGMCLALLMTMVRVAATGAALALLASRSVHV